MMSAGHRVAAGRALSYLSKTAIVLEHIGGIPFYQLLESLENEFEDRKEELIANLDKVIRYIFRPENLMVDYTAEHEGLAGVESFIENLKGKLYTDPVEATGYDPKPVRKNEGFMTSAQIQYVCRAGDFGKKELPYNGALHVLRVMMGYDYLWTQVRVKGGAYGCMCDFFKTGESYFVSYRDPNLKNTIDVYEKAADYIAHFEADERTMTQYIIGAISEMDTPMTPAMKGSYSLTGYMTHYSYEMAQKDRDELLSTDANTIRGLAEYIRAFMDEDCLCVVGNEENIKANNELFENTDYLFH